VEVAALAELALTNAANPEKLHQTKQSGVYSALFCYAIPLLSLK
jgi:hypothetical protein